MADKTVLTTYPNAAAAMRAATDAGLTIGEPQFQIIGYEGGVAQYNIYKVTHYFLEPRGMLHRDRDGTWILMTYQEEEVANAER